MDGASKFVRGDAIAAVIITIVNIGGGLIIGMVQRGWTAGESLDLFTKLTIGDGLVSQIPAFIISLGAGLIVTRSSTPSDLGDQVLAEMFARLANRPLRVWRVPAGAARVVVGPVQADDLQADAVFSNIRLRGIGFRFRYPTLGQGLQQICGALHE